MQPYTHIHDGIEIVVVAAHHIAAVHHDVVVAAVLVGLLLLLLLLLQVQVDLLVVPAVVASTLAQTLQSFAIVVLCTGRAGRKFGQMAAIKSLGMANLTCLEAGVAVAAAAGHWGIISILCMLHVACCFGSLYTHFFSTFVIYCSSNNNEKCLQCAFICANLKLMCLIRLPLQLD